MNNHQNWGLNHPHVKHGMQYREEGRLTAGSEIQGLVFEEGHQIIILCILFPKTSS